MVLALTDRFDAHADLVLDKLKAKNVPYFRMNLDVASLGELLITFRGGFWEITDGLRTVRSCDISCVWCRRAFVELTLQEQELTEIDFKVWKNEWNKTLTGLYNSLKHLPWLNPVRAAYRGENKYYQMELAREIGFSMPDMVVSNRKQVLTDFARLHGRVVLKLMAQEIYVAGEHEFRGFYTNIITEEDLRSFAETGENPVVLQKYVDKSYEVRYTVVGDSHFVCKIDSQKSDRTKYDWRRYDIPHTPHVQITAPETVRAQVTEMLSRLGLEFGAFDFIVTPENQWVFLEVNCMGQWLWIEQLAGLRISDAHADWLAGHTRIGTGGNI